ncbi:hypothetical protein CDD81_5786 [Ophiocordyceps australis]|uniref:Peroxidase n=1 Tax=Ophiocordyceps australis TaxID=1399860 RepID=A0A2C5Y1Y5_9HYPO|nr:hypothetical protein CDD81_5786 [Ophiocordyceps australis]
MPPLTLLSLALLLPSALSYPNMETLRSHASLSRRSTALIGDLTTLPLSQLSPTGHAIRAILNGTASGLDTTSTYSPPPRDSPACAADTCCIYAHLASAMRTAMLDPSGQCNNLARSSLRLGFHDAAGWSSKTGPAGGADGSIVLAGECEARAVNNGLQDACAQMRVWHDAYKASGVSMADVIQLAANVGTVVCPLGPRVRSFVGRKDSSVPAPEGNVPEATDSIDKLLSMFQDKTISPAGLVALVGAHTASQQFFFDPARAGAPQDTTPHIWDTDFYGNTLQEVAPNGIVRFDSDVALSRDPRTSSSWQGFQGAQGFWAFAYGQEYVRLSLLGVSNINDLTECTKVLPEFISTVPAGLDTN